MLQGGHGVLLAMGLGGISQECLGWEFDPKVKYKVALNVQQICKDIVGVQCPS